MMAKARAIAGVDIVDSAIEVPLAVMHKSLCEEGRLTEQQLDGFRQEISHAPNGLPSYPHPRLMRDFWEFPTVSMGLSPLQAIYQARFNRYLHDRQIKDTSRSHVWAFLGDGEMDEVERRGQPR